MDLNKIYSTIRDDNYISAGSLLREEFIKRGLSYENITQNKFYLLVGLLAEELDNFDNPNIKMSISVGANKPLYKKNKKTGFMQDAYIKVSSGYFSGREAFSFNKEGLLGYANWASGYTNAPFVSAFIRWLDIITSAKK